MHRLIHRRSATPGTPAAPVPFKSKLTKRTLSAVAPMATIAFMSIAFCCLLSGHLAAITSDIPRYLSPVAARYEGHVESSYGVEGGYWGLSVNYSYPSLSLVDRTRYLVANSSCWELAKSHAEPYCKDYQATQMTPLELPGSIPRAIWRWKGKISRQLFDSVPFLLRGSDVAHGCQHCTFVLRYKVIAGRLYTDRRRRHRALDGQEEEASLIEELLLAALHVYKVEDVDFLLHLGDGSPAGLPLVQVNINRSHEQAGFTLPKFMWRDALGPHQFRVLTQCLQARYPVLPQQQRLQRAVWRGSNTDNNILLMDERNVMHVMRTRLHMFGLWYSDTIDAHFTAFAQQAFDTNCVEELLPPGPPLPLEQFNHYALVLDIDGNAWSDRYRLLSHFNTPVLKQASNLSAFFEHVMAAGTVVEQYAHDLSDLPVKARALLQELQQSPTRLTRMAEQQQGLAHYLLSQLALIHATAYTLDKVAELSDWKPVMEDAYELVPFNRCCSYAKQLPAEFIQDVRTRGSHHGLRTR